MSSPSRSRAGRGSVTAEYREFGISNDNSASIMAEANDLILRAWSEERFSFQGQHYRYEVRAIEAGGTVVAESRPGAVDVTTPAILVVLDAGHGGADPGAVARA